jgi:hypothetical protein
MVVNLSISPRRVGLWLFVVAVVLNLLGFVGRAIEYLLGYKETTELVRLVHPTEEGNITTWFSALLLLLSAILLALIAKAKKTEGAPYVRHWTVLSFIFLYMSVDEAARIHELTQGPLRAALNPSGFFHYAWVIIAIPLVLLFVLAYLRFLRDLPQDARRLFIVSGVLFVTGALGMDMLSGYFRSYPLGRWDLNPILVTIEEFLENVGIILFIYALLSYIKSHLPTRISLECV